MLNRKLICVLCIVTLLISGCGSSGVSTNNSDNTDEYLIDVENKGRADAIKLVFTVTRGEFEKREFDVGNITYTDLYYENLDLSSNVEVKKIKAGVGDKVKKGDVIFTYKVVIDEVELRRKTLEVEQHEKEYAAELDTRKAEIKTAEKELKSIRDKNKREIKELEIKKLKLGLSKFQETKSAINKERAELNEMKSGDNATKVIATHDGYILSLYDIEEDQVISGSQPVAIITGRKEYYIELENITNDAVRYGDKVEIVVEGRKGEKNTTVEGEVFSASNILNPRSNQFTASVRILNEPEGIDWSNPIKVYYKAVDVKNALLIPIKAVLHDDTDGVNEDDSAYVYIRKDDDIRKQYLNIIDKNNEFVRVEDGVEEGDILVVYNHS